jgi:hypothetical protein
MSDPYGRILGFLDRKEHTQAIKNKSSSTVYSTHRLSTRHRYGTITDAMDMVRTHKRKKAQKHIEKIPRIQNQQR